MNNNKPILAIETSERICGVCLYFDEDKYYEFSISFKNSHSEKIFELIDKIFITSGSSINQVSSIAVSSGPGSFTGLRIGMSAAKGLAFGASLPIIPVPTFEAMALQLSNLLAEETFFKIANKVNAEELYFARFQVKGNSYIFAENLQIIKQSELIKEANKELIFGNFIENSEISSDIFSAPSPKYIAEWAKIFGSNLLTYNYDLLEPNYLKELIIKGMRK